jgi:hypothetical protein
MQDIPLQRVVQPQMSIMQRLTNPESDQEGKGNVQKKVCPVSRLEEPEE